MQLDLVDQFASRAIVSETGEDRSIVSIEGMEQVSIKLAWYDSIVTPIMPGHMSLQLTVRRNFAHGQLLINDTKAN